MFVRVRLLPDDYSLPSLWKGALMKRRALLQLAGASAAGLLLPPWLWEAPRRRLLVPGFTPPARATAAEVQRLIRRWQRAAVRPSQWPPGNNYLYVMGSGEYVPSTEKGERECPEGIGSRLATAKIQAAEEQRQKALSMTRFGEGIPPHLITRIR
jgi:hypothetical protein